MAIKSISEFYSFSLFIFDLDNTIYKEEDYLFQAYIAIARKFAKEFPEYNEQYLFQILIDLQLKYGREKLFDRFLIKINLDSSYIPICLNILRSFKPEKKIEVNETVKTILSNLKNLKTPVFILTNGNVMQQKNKIKNINWGGLDNYLHFVFASDIEPKPSSAGVEYILNKSGTGKDKAVFIGDSEVDQLCAENSGIDFISINNLFKLI